MICNINCQVAPLLDSIQSRAYEEMVKEVTKRQAWFQKEIQNMKKKEAKLLKRLDVLDAPQREAARLAAEAEAAASRPDLKKAAGKRMTAKEKKAEEERLRKEEEERKAREEEEARLKAEEEERKRKEEEEKKAAAAKDKKGAKGKKGAAEEVEEPVEETEEVKLEREKGEINAELETIRTTMR